MIFFLQFHQITQIAQMPSKHRTTWLFLFNFYTYNCNCALCICMNYYIFKLWIYILCVIFITNKKLYHSPSRIFPHWRKKIDIFSVFLYLSTFNSQQDKKKNIFIRPSTSITSEYIHIGCVYTVTTPTCFLHIQSNTTNFFYFFCTQFFGIYTRA